MTTTAQMHRRRKLMLEMGKREGKPLQLRYATPKRREYSFIGLAFELMRQEKPELFCWSDDDKNGYLFPPPNPDAHIPSNDLRYGVTGLSYAWMALEDWLGLTEDQLRWFDTQPHLSWKFLANELKQLS